MTAAPVMSITDELVAELDALANANHAYVPVPPNTMRALLAERAELKRDAERRIPLYEAVDRACRDLPDGWEIRLCMERGSGWIELYDDCGEHCDGFPTNNERLDYTLNDAIVAAIQAYQ